jgi:hypothetical protein
VLFVFINTDVLAVADDFTIGITVGSDSNPPTIPAPVSATPVSSSQIDVFWGASVDDQSLSGYRLFRDAVQIATTTLLTYSDTGLSASTTYTYTVQAYDWMMNISTTSSAVATTTFQAPVVSTTTPDLNTSNRLHVRLLDLQIDTTKTTALLQWSTNTYSKYVLRWGRYNSYDLGFVQTDVFKKSHQTLISDLEPGTTYKYEIIGYGRDGTEYILSRDSFTTTYEPSTDAPMNVSGVHVNVSGDDVVLSWVNPDDAGFTNVRVVRNYNFYPRDTVDGVVVYHGTGESVYDSYALQFYDNQYYTIFTYDSNGNISSGVVVFVQKKITKDNTGSDANVTHTQFPDTGNYNSDNTIATTSSGDQINIGFFDVDILQNSIEIVPIEEAVHVIQRVPVVFQIPYNRLPEHLKTIVMTIDAGSAQQVSYLLRINTDKSVYQAVVPPFDALGVHELRFEIYDYQTQVKTTFYGNIEVDPYFDTTTKQKQWQQNMQFYIGMIGSFFIFIIILFLFYIGFVRRTEDK